MKLRIQTFLTICLFSMTALFFGCSDDSNSTGPDLDSDISLSQALTDSSNTDLSTLAGLIESLGLAAQLDSQQDVTVFAPTDSAFAKLEGMVSGLSQDQLTEIINYHISTELYSSDDLGGQAPFAIPTAQGDSIYVRNRNSIDLNHTTAITEADIETSNGFVHKIDELLLPDAYLNTFEVARKRYQLAKFTCSCTAGRTGLSSTLTDSSQSLTVFAPTNEAFNNLEVNVDDLSDMELQEIMSYHIIEGQALTASELTDGMELTTLNGATLTVSVADDGSISLNDGQATVVVKNIEGTNGVVYKIDSVLDVPEGGSGGM